MMGLGDMGMRFFDRERHLELLESVFLHTSLAGPLEFLDHSAKSSVWFP